jgi:transposase
MSKQPKQTQAFQTRERGHGQKKRKRQKGSVANLPVLRPDAAGIDVGTEELWVAVPEDRDEQPVRCFRSFTNGVKAMVEWLKQCRIQTVALESTGVLWITVFQMLEDAGLEVCLVNARHYQNVPGKRTDVEDCQWLRFLHSVGLLRPSFRPEQAVCAVRTLVRHREQLVQMRSQHIQHMHKALDQMNLKVHYVISDIVGASGQKIVRGVLGGERDPAKLAELRDRNIKATAEQIRESLVGDFREEHLFTLKQSLSFYDEYSRQIGVVEAEIEKYTARLKTKLELEGTPDRKPCKPRKSKGKRGHLAKMRELCHEKFGVDVCRIPGMQRGGIAETLLAEVGTDLAAFDSSGAFGAWPGLAPNHQISGGKILSRKTRKMKHPVANAFRMAAQSLEHSKSYLGRHYRSMKGRLGAPKAITAVAHKIARIFWAMVKKQKEYDESLFDKHEQQNRERMRKRLERQAAQMGLKLVPAS